MKMFLHHLNILKNTLNEHKNDWEKSFKNIFKECEIILNELNEEIKLPRLVEHQKYRNCPTNSQSPEVYYTGYIFIYLD